MVCIYWANIYIPLLFSFNIYHKTPIKSCVLFQLNLFYFTHNYFSGKNFSRWFGEKMLKNWIFLMLTCQKMNKNKTEKHLWKTLSMDRWMNMDIFQRFLLYALNPWQSVTSVLDFREISETVGDLGLQPANIGVSKSWAP